MVKRSLRAGRNFRDEEIAVLRIQMTEYEQLLRHAKPLALHKDWASYSEWIERCIQKGLDCGWPVEVYERTAQEILAFSRMKCGGNLDTATLCAYALHIHGTEKRNS